MQVYKGVSMYQFVSIIGIVAVLVIVSVLFGKNKKLAEDFQQENVIEVVNNLGEAVLGASSSSGDSVPVFEYEVLATLDSVGITTVDGEGFVYTDEEHGFEISGDTQSVTSDETMTHLPFYWDERYEGVVVGDDIQMYVIDRDFQTFVSGISYGVGESYTTSNDVYVTPRTTGYDKHFVHQAYINIEDGKTLMLMTRSDESQYPNNLQNYINTITRV